MWLVVYSSTVLHGVVRLKCAAVTMVYSDLSEGKNNSGVAEWVCWAPTTVNRPGIRRWKVTNESHENTELLMHRHVNRHSECLWHTHKSKHLQSHTETHQSNYCFLEQREWLLCKLHQYLLPFPKPTTGQCIYCLCKSKEIQNKCNKRNLNQHIRMTASYYILSRVDL